MSAKTAAALLAGALAASTGTAAALTKGHVFRLQQGDEANYGTVTCQAVYVPPYSGVDCVGARGYEILYGPSEVRVLHSKGKHVQQVWAVNPSGR